jgi:hypothetical protein
MSDDYESKEVSGGWALLVFAAALALMILLYLVTA